MSETTGIRLNKYISDTGFCSRREADSIIEAGRVAINGKPALLGTRVGLDDEVTIDGKAIGKKETAVYLAFNKPVGIICTTDRNVKHNIVDFINHPKRIFPVGRLDRPSEGLIFMTNDGDIVNKILRAGNNHEKEYVVSVHKPVTADFIDAMKNGVPILDTVTKKCFVKQTGKNEFKIILTQGLNRQIRRMCEYLGYEVTKLKRVRIMNVSIQGIVTGKWRALTATEMAEIYKAVAQSSKTEEASRINEDEME